MSFLDIDNLSPLDLVTQYILEVRGRGHFVTREESTLIQAWLEIAGNQPEIVILALESILPERLIKAREANKKNVTMIGINKSVRKKLEDQKSLAN